MKIVFNFSRVLTALAVAAVVAAPGSARAETVYWTARDLLADFFHTSARVSFQKVELRGELRTRIEGRLGYALGRDSYTVFVATSGQRIDGYAVFDEENGEHLPITFAVKLSPQGAVERQEVVVYREPRGEEVRDERFRRQFVGKTARDALRAGDDVQVVSGATISSRSMAVGVRRALVIVEEAVLRPAQISSASPPLRR
jgi:hypothetical protein